MRSLQVPADIQRLMREFDEPRWGYRRGDDGEIECMLFDGEREEGWTDSPARVDGEEAPIETPAGAVDVVAFAGNVDATSADDVVAWEVGKVRPDFDAIDDKDALEDIAKSLGGDIDRRRNIAALRGQVAAMWDEAHGDCA